MSPLTSQLPRGMMKPLVSPCSRALWYIGLVLWSCRGIQRRGVDPAQLEEDQDTPRCLFPVPPSCHTYHDHSNHDSSDTNQVELPREEFIDFFVAVCVLRQRSTPVRQPAFPSPTPSTEKGRSASPWPRSWPQDFPI